jgi:hypothetical protein
VAIAGIAFLSPLQANAEVFGECAHQSDLAMKISACVDASKSTSYPWILRWVYRELAIAQRERDQMKDTIASGARSLAREDREPAQREP